MVSMRNEDSEIGKVLLDRCDKSGRREIGGNWPAASISNREMTNPKLNILEPDFYTKKCTICCDSKTGAKLKCKNCGVVVHKSCYGYKQSSNQKKKDWNCHICDPKHKDVAARNKRCDLCFQEGGALIYAKGRSKTCFVHIVCAIALPEVRIESTDTGFQTAYLEGLVRSRKKCSHCKKSGGFQTKCFMCNKRSHVTCAMQNNWRKGVERIDGCDVAVSFCDEHCDQVSRSKLEQIEQALAKMQGFDTTPGKVEIFSDEDEWTPENQSVQPVEIEIEPEKQVKASEPDPLNSDVECESDNEPILFTSPKKTKRERSEKTKRKREAAPEPPPKRKRLNNARPQAKKKTESKPPPLLKKQSSTSSVRKNKKSAPTEQERVEKHFKDLATRDCQDIYAPMARICKIYKKERPVFQKIVERFFDHKIGKDDGWSVCLRWCEYWGNEADSVDPVRRKQFFDTLFQFLARIRKIDYSMRPPTIIVEKVTSLCENPNISESCKKIKEILKPFARIIPKKTSSRNRAKKQPSDSSQTHPLARSNSTRGKSSNKLINTKSKSVKESRRRKLQHSKTIELGKWENLGINWKDQLFGEHNVLAAQFENKHEVRIQLRGKGSGTESDESLHVLIEGDYLNKLETAKAILDHQISILAHTKSTEMKKKGKYNEPPPPPVPRYPARHDGHAHKSRQHPMHQRIKSAETCESSFQEQKQKVSEVDRNCEPIGDGIRVVWRLIERKDRSGNMTHFWWNCETNQTCMEEPRQWGYYSPNAISSDSEVELCATSDDSVYTDDEITDDHPPIVENLYKDLPKLPTTTCTEESYTTDLSATLSDHDNSFRIENQKKPLIREPTPPPPPVREVKKAPEKRKKTRFDHAPPTEVQVKIDLAAEEDRPADKPAILPWKWRESWRPQRKPKGPKLSRSRSQEPSSRGRSGEKSNNRSNSRRRWKRSDSLRRRKRSRSKSRSRSSPSRSRVRRRKRSGSRSYRRPSSSRSYSSRSSRSYSPRERRRRRRSRSNRRRDRKKKRSRSSSRRRRRRDGRRRKNRYRE